MQRMVNGGTVNSWICINFARNVQDNVAHSFCHELAQMCMTSGMVTMGFDMFFVLSGVTIGTDFFSQSQAFNPQPVLPVLSGRPDQVERVLKARFHDVMTKLQPHKKELDLLIVILPDNNGSLYGTI